jgi:hypothetical protein
MKIYDKERETMPSRNIKPRNQHKYLGTVRGMCYFTHDLVPIVEGIQILGSAQNRRDGERHT